MKIVYFPGGFLYYSDIPFLPHQNCTAYERSLPREYYETSPDFVLTMETKGIPVALMTAHALEFPYIAWRSSKVYGLAVNINRRSGSSGHIETMSLSRRAVQEGQRALIIDDFIKAGGTAKGMIDLMHEFNVTVVGLGLADVHCTTCKKKRAGRKSTDGNEIFQEDNPVAKCNLPNG